jgi:hypothetical protein
MSKDLVPFHILDEKQVFLPVNSRLEYALEELTPQSRDHYLFLSQVYENLKKRGARQETLWDYIAYNGKTTNPLQTNPLKVVYNSIGRKRVKAAILRDFVIADDSLYYFTPETEEEASYLAAILNSNLVSFAVVNIKDERNIHKNPWRLPVPLWEESPIQQDISILGKAMEEKISVNVGAHLPASSKKTLESEILSWIDPELTQLDIPLRELFGMS